MTPQQTPSFMAESFFGALTSVIFSETGSCSSVVLITSPNPAEGKTNTACNLAITWAQMAGRILLIDGDLRKPRLHGIFDLPNDYGLSELLHDERPIDEYPLERLQCGARALIICVFCPEAAKLPWSREVFARRAWRLLRRFRASLTPC